MTRSLLVFVVLMTPFFALASPKKAKKVVPPAPKVVEVEQELPANLHNPITIEDVKHLLREGNKYRVPSLSEAQLEDISRPALFAKALGTIKEVHGTRSVMVVTDTGCLLKVGVSYEWRRPLEKNSLVMIYTSVVPYETTTEGFFEPTVEWTLEP